MAAGKQGIRKRGPQERAEITKRKLIEVALREFSGRGFDAVTVRDIEVLAGVQRNLVSYHFGSKAELWKAAAAHNIKQFQAFTEQRRELMLDLTSAHERLVYLIRSFVRFNAKHPELNRLLLEEGTQESWRIEWLVENQVKPAMLKLKSLVEVDLGLSDEEFVNWYYLHIGGGAMIFSLAPEAKLLFGVNTLDEEVVNRHADMLTDLLLMRAAKSAAS